MIGTKPFLACLALMFFAGPIAALDAQTLYGQHCAQCHGATLRGSAHGSSLKGGEFKEKWADQNWQSLARHNSRTMPPGEPDKLTLAEHDAVAQFVFSANEFSIDVIVDQQGQSEEVAGSDSWTGAAGVAEIARSRSNFINGQVEGFRSVTNEELNHPSPDDWLSWRRTLDGQAETPLTQVNKKMSKNLAWRGR